MSRGRDSGGRSGHRRSLGHGSAKGTRRKAKPLRMEALEPRLLLAMDPIISEFLASNDSGLRDGDGDTSDWIEIYNPDSRDAVDLTGWQLRYKTNNYWSFPPMTLGPGEFRIVFANGDKPAAADPNGELRADFNLSKDGGRLRLLNPLGETVQDIDYPEQLQDISYGVGQEVTETKVLEAGVAARYHVPTDDSLGTAWTDPSFVDADWSSGSTGLGWADSVPGFASWCYKSSSVSTIGNLATAQSIIDNPANQRWMLAETTPSINYWNTGSRGHFIYDTAFPGIDQGQADYNYVVQATATIDIPAAGTWTFGFNSDDGCRLTIPGVAFTNAYGTGATISQGSLQYDGTRTANDTLGLITFPSAGKYEMGLLYYQGVSSAGVELFAVQGSFTSWGATTAWRLLGDTANGGLSVESVPFTGPANSVSSAVKTNVRAQMQEAIEEIRLATGDPDANTSLYVRVPFNAPGWQSLASLTLKMAYDDGYVAYVNGTEVARRNAPATLAWNSEALAERASDVQSSTMETIDISSLLDPGNPSHLQASGNVLAIQVLRASPADRDLLVLPEIAQISSTELGLHFFATPTPASANSQRFWRRAEAPEFSVKHGYYDNAFALELETNTDGGAIYYTLDSSAPWAANIPTLLTTAIASSGTTATLTLKNHGYSAGDLIQVVGADQAEYNGVFSIFNVLTDTFSYTMPATPPGSSTGSITILKVDRAVAGISALGATATAVVPGHGLATGDLVRILGAAEPEYNGDFEVTVLDENTFSYSMESAPAGPASGGLAMRKLGERYAAPIPITTTTTVRARVYHAEFEPSEILTRTYLFVEDVINQPADPPGFPENWETWPADYQMDPRITEDPAYKDVMREALLSLPTISIVSDKSQLFDANTGILASPVSLAGSGDPMRAVSSIEYFDPNGGDSFQVNAGVQIYGGASRGAKCKKHGLRVVFREEFGPGKLDFPLFGDDAADEFDTFVLRCSYGDQWTVSGSTVQFIKDAYAGATQLALGQPGKHSSFVNVYIDGLYWGLYDMCERPDASFAASYMGGDKDDWEANNAGYDNNITNNIPYWNALLADTKVGFSTTAAQGGVPGFNTTLYAAAESTTPGFTTTVYRANVTVNSLSAAESVIATPGNQISTATDTAEVINYLNTGADGHFTTGNNTFPGMGTTEVGNFAVEITSAIEIPSSGYWSFGMNGNDGFKITLTNGVESYTTSLDGTRTAPTDKCAAFNIARPGSYRMRLVYFQNTGGAELELFAAQGNYTSWGATTNWRLVGDTANGGLASYVVLSVTSLADAEAIAADPAKQAWTKTQTPATINYITTGADGRFTSGNVSFPGTGSSTPLQSFVVVAESTISIPKTGTWTFAVNSDDGFRLTLKDGATTVLDSYRDGLRTPGDTFKTVNITTAGSYSLRLIYYQGPTAGAEVELYATKGDYSAWGATTSWQLVGSNVYYTSSTMAKAGLLSLAAPMELNNLTDAENVLTPVYRSVERIAAKEAVTSITRSGSVATVTRPGHGFVEGQAVLISGADQSQYNTTFVIYNVAVDTFQITVSSSAPTPATGIISAQPYGITRNRDTAVVWLPDHGYSVGDYVKITGASPGDYNGTFPISDVTLNTFSYLLAGVPSSPSTGSAVTVCKACQAWSYTQTLNTVNHLTTGTDGHTGGNVAFPGTLSGNLTENFAVESKTTIEIPSAGPWTFAVNSDEGFSLTLVGETDTFSFDYNGLRTPSDSLATFNIDRPGMYRLRLVYFQKSAGAELELYAAAGAWNSWSDTNAWRLVGELGGLGTSLSYLATVTTYKANAPVTTLAEAQSVVNDTLKQEWSVTEYCNLINFLNTGDEGHFGASVSFPGIPKADPATEVDDFVVQVDATVNISSTGLWTFHVGCDDGFSLVVYDGMTAMTPVMERTGTGDYTDTVEVFNFPHTGMYSLQLIYYQHTGAAGLELSATKAPSAKAVAAQGSTYTVSSQKTVTSITRSDSTATVTCSSHGYSTGELVLISGATQPEYNGTFPITVVNTNTFTYEVPGDPVSPATGTLRATRGGLTRVGSTATATLMNHGFVEGQAVLMGGAGQSQYNGTFVIFNVTPHTFDYTVSGEPATPATGTVTVRPYGVSRSGTTAIVSLVNHGFATGDTIRIAGADQAEYNGTFTVTALSANTFTYEISGEPASPATGAAITALNLTFNPSTFRLVGDTINGGQAIGSAVSIEDMYYFLQGENPDGTPNPNYPVLLDIDNYIDYLLVTHYLGTTDWPGHNFYSARPPDPGSTGYKSFAWDNDSSLSNLNANNTKAYTMIAQPYYYLCGSLEFRMRFADHIQQALYNGGPLTPDVAAERYAEIAGTIAMAVIAESARWGDIPASPAPLPHTVEQWQNTINNCLTGFLPNRTSVLIAQYRANGILPGIDAPSFAVAGTPKYGGTFHPGESLVMNAASSATIYYCLDGSDPRLPGGGLNPAALCYTGALVLEHGVLVKARAWLNGEWSALADVSFFPDLAPAIRITELMYHPADPSPAELAAGFGDADDFEYLEIKNVGDETVPLGGLYLANGIDYTFPNVTIEPGQYLVVASNPAAFLFRYPDRAAALVDQVSGYSGHLNNAGEKIELDSPVGGVIHEFSYSDGWYSITDGDGFSLTVIDPEQSLSLWDKSKGWRASAAPGGTPGFDDTLLAPGSVIISEVLPHTSPPQADSIELSNTTDAPIDVGGWFLSDSDGDLTKYEIAAGTVIPARGYLVLNEYDHFANPAAPGCHTTFALSEYGEDVYLSSNAGGVAGGYREHVDFTATPNGVAQGLYVKSTGGTDFTLLQTPTLGADNATIPYISPLVLNEIMYHPAAPTPAEEAAGWTNADDFEFLELYNRSETTLRLADFFLGDGVGFTFGWSPTGTPGEVWTLEPGATATWTPAGLAADTYTVYVHFTLLGGDGRWRSLDDNAPYTINTASGPVVVTIDQDDARGGDADVWIELGAFALDASAWVQLERAGAGVGDWTIAERVKFVRPGEEIVVGSPVLDSFATASGRTTLEPGAYLVLVSNYEAFDARYGIAANNIPVAGVYTGNLANDGEMLRLYQFGDADPGIIPAYPIDHVSYKDSGAWPGRADGDGAALMRVHPAAYANDANNWQSTGMGGTPGGPNVRLDKLPPTAPANLAAVVTIDPESRVSLSWSAAEDSESFVDHYVVYRTGQIAVSVYGTSYVDAALAAATPYTYRVSAVNRDGYESGLSAPVTVSVPGVVSYGTPEGRVEVVFSEPLRADVAGLAANYAINGAEPTSVTLGAGNTKVILETAAFNATTLVAPRGTARFLVPADASLGTSWIQPGFDDSAWSSGSMALGFSPSLPAEVEPNDTLAGAGLAARNFAAYSGNLYHFGLTGTADSNDDWFNIGPLDPGDVISITGSGAPSSRGTSTNLRVELYRLGSGSGTLVTSNDDSGPGLDALIPRYAITTADTYYVKIKRYNTSVAYGTYDLALWLENTGPAPSTGGTMTAEVESNNGLTSANNAASSWRTAQYLSRTTGAISSSGDVDYYKYAFTAGDLVTVYIDATSTLDAKVSLLSSGGSVLAVEDGSSGFSSPYDRDAPLFGFVIPSTGTYYVKVESSGSSTGSYNADVYLASDSPPPDFDSLIGTDLAGQMQGVNSTLYVREEFEVADPAAFSQLILRMRYDDGYVAWLNGTEIARRNAPATPAWNSAATASRADAESALVQAIDITNSLSLLQPGTNVLAVQALNRTAADNDMLVMPELLGSRVGSHYTVTMSNLATESGSQLPDSLQIAFDYVPQGVGYILRETWTGLGGTNVADLTNNGNYPDNPTERVYEASLERPYNTVGSYGDRIAGYIYPPMTGSYTFWIASDDTSELWLSTDDDPAHRQKIAYVAAVTTYPLYRQWTAYATQKSAPVTLVAGQKYYIEVLHKQNSGTDNCSVRWQLPDGRWENGDLNAPIPGIRLSPLGELPDMTPPSVPGDFTATLVDNAQVVLAWSASTDVDSGVAGYQVYRDGMAYGAPTADTSFTDASISSTQRHRYQVAALNADGYASALSVPLNVVPAGIASVVAWSPTGAQVKFTEPLDRTTAENAANYTIGGLNVTEARLEADGLTVSLTTSAMTFNGAYTLAATGLRNTAGDLLPAGGPQAFTYGGSILREYYLGVGGGALVSDLNYIPSFPNNPTGTTLLASMETPVNGLSNTYSAEQMRGYLCPNVTGTYYFWIASDDGSELWISTNEDPANKQLVASVTGSTSSRQWGKYESQKSGPITLVAGRRYYVEAVAKQNSSSNNLAVAWQRPGAATIQEEGSAQWVASIVADGSTATVTLSNHGFVTGQSIRIQGAEQEAYNGVFTITYLSSSTFRYEMSDWPDSPATGSILAGAFGISYNGTRAIVNLPGHGFATNDAIAVYGADQAGFNGVFTITSVTTNTFQYTPVGSPESPATGWGMTAAKLLPIPGNYLVPAAPYGKALPYAVALDTRGTTDPTPALQGTVSDRSLVVTVMIDGVYYAAANHGDGTWTLADNAIAQPLDDGVYEVVLCAVDAYGRVGFDTTAGELIVDTVPPTAEVTGFGAALRETSVDQVQIVFSEPVAGFDLADVRFTRDNGPDLITGAESLTTTDRITWTLSGLPVQDRDGIYRFTVLAIGSGIEDVAESRLAGDAVGQWRRDTSGPIAVVDAVDPNPRTLPVEQLTIRFDEPIFGLTLANLSLEFSGGPNLLTAAQTLGTSDNVHWVLGNLSGLTGALGNYSLTVTAGGISDELGHAMGGGASGTWFVVAPNLDVDGDGAVNPLTDGILILRYLFEAHGTWSVGDALGSGAVRAAAPSIQSFLDGSLAMLDADGNGSVDALSDGILILRYLFDPGGTWAVDDALGIGATRTTRAAIKAYLDQFHPAAAPPAAADVFETSSGATLPTGVAAALQFEAAARQSELPVAELRVAEPPSAAGDADDEVRAVDAVLQHWDQPVIATPLGEQAAAGESEEDAAAVDLDLDAILL